MKIAIVGSGISGLACAHYLHRQHEVHVLEAAPKIGGHTATVDVAMGGRRYAVDTGFIVYNDWTYPNFIALMDELGVSSKATAMSFSLSDKPSGLEYAGSNLNTLFAQRRNLISPTFWRMILDILRFNKESIKDLEQGRIDGDMTLGEYLAERKYSRAFREYYLVPMGSAIWSADTEDMLAFPLQFFVRFFRNHGLLSVSNRPQWRVIEGGSREYLQPLCAGFNQNIRTGVRLQAVERHDHGVDLLFEDGKRETFDQLVLACHSDQALKLLADASVAESEVLGAIPYQSNDVVLHTDTRLLPRNSQTWSSWNYLRKTPDQRATLTYNMNILQGIDAPQTFCVTLNDTDSINPHKILGRFQYDHPVFTLEGMRAQERWAEVNGRQRTWFCGAYWRNGFHEDGVVSARRVADALLAQGSNPVASLVSAA